VARGDEAALAHAYHLAWVERKAGSVGVRPPNALPGPADPDLAAKGARRILDDGQPMPLGNRQDLLPDRTVCPFGARRGSLACAP
jgi:hypothetical protein